jgi:hypothetical protein
MGLRGISARGGGSGGKLARDEFLGPINLALAMTTGG